MSLRGRNTRTALSAFTSKLSSSPSSILLTSGILMILQDENDINTPVSLTTASLDNVKQEFALAWPLRCNFLGKFLYFSFYFLFPTF